MDYDSDTSALTQGIAQAVEDSQFAGMDDENKKRAEAEKKTVKECFEAWKQSRDFDKNIRQQYAVDRRYAAGTADQRWAVSTNLIGSFIDILTSFLYARDPEVSGRKAPQVDNRGTKAMDDFAKTMELVISRLWKKARLKTAARKQVRSALSVGVGWLKVVLIADAPTNPEMQNEMNDLRDNLAKLEAIQANLASIEGADGEKVDYEVAQQQELIASLEHKVEATIRKYLAVDFIAAQNMQTSLDVDSTEDYLDADWNSNSIYILKSAVAEKFPRVTEEDLKSATCYYQRPLRDLQPVADEFMTSVGAGNVSADDADYYTKGTASTSQGSEQGPEFIRVIEKWDKRTNHIKTMIEGVHVWAKEPYQPPYASSRFFPYFRLAFFEVDGSRNPQSLSWRLRKLQDEYSNLRSNLRLTRQRAIPGVIFNAAALSPQDARKIEQGVAQEMIGITPTIQETPIQNLFAPKPVAQVDMRMFDPQPILSDMEKISGVQEALQSSVGTPKTATEANIQQSGFASRTTSDRDVMEDMLDDLANYTGELALSALNIKDVQRIAGAAAFWPEKMSVDDIVTMVEITIKAGSTGKPKDEAGRQAWGVILPVLKEAIIGIQEAAAMGNLPLAKSLAELVRETMARMGDDTDPERFIPEMPEEGILETATGGVPSPGAATPLPLEGGEGDVGTPPPDLQNPTLQ